MKRYSPGLLLVAFVIVLLAFNNNKKADAQQLIDAEHAFSKMSMEKGQKEAFLHYMAEDDGVVLRNNNFPLKGIKAKEFLTKNDAGPNVLSWEPAEASIADNGDMGYTYRYLCFPYERFYLQRLLYHHLEKE